MSENTGNTRWNDAPDGASSISDIAADAASRDPIGKTASADFASGCEPLSAAAQGKKGTSVASNALIWFGAGVSIAEILTGTYFVTLGWGRGIAAILLGHLIGGLMMFAAGMIGAMTKKSAMETVGLSFGRNGARIFSVLNVLQLLGWTAIMIYDGAISANGVVGIGVWFWALVIGVLILVWIMIGLTNLGKLNTIAMVLLLILSFLLLRSILVNGTGSSDAVIDDSLSFGAAVELAVAMPLSWLPLISDYTREAEKPVRATAASVIVYSAVSIFMYIIGMGAAMMTGEGDIAQIMMAAGLGIAGLLIVVLSTVTTTFLDAYSAGVSSESIHEKLPAKTVAIVVTVIGTIGAMLFVMDDITDFLYLIGSVFAPMIAIQVADFFVLKKEAYKGGCNVRNVVIWVVGFILYRILMNVDTPVGNTLPDMLITIVICIAADKLLPSHHKDA